MTDFSSTETQFLKEIAEGMESYLYGQNWPPEYTNLFRMWGYFNRIYNTLYKGEEWEKIALFAIDSCFTSISDTLQQEQEDALKRLVQQPCVGDGRKEFKPLERTRIASNTLRAVFQINVQQICQSKKCRERQAKGWDICLMHSQANLLQNVATPDHAKHTLLGAILLIIYQIRCNLFHGSKTDMNGEEFERNQLLVQASAEIMEKLLKEIEHIIKSINANQEPLGT